VNLTLRRSAAETGGQLLELEAEWRSHSARPPEHLHPSQDEHFEILSGSMTVRIAGEERIVSAGDKFDVPAGTPHEMWTTGEPARALWQVRPALRTQTFFETIWGLAGDGKLNSKGAPGILQGALLAQEYSDVFRLTKPPRPVQKVAFALLAPIARLRGHRGRYDRYSGPQAR